MTITKEEVLTWLEWKGACPPSLKWVSTLSSIEEAFRELTASELAWLLEKIGGLPWDVYFGTTISEWDKCLHRRAEAYHKRVNAVTHLPDMEFFSECEIATRDYRAAINAVLRRECTLDRVVEKIKADLQRPCAWSII